MRLCLPSQLHAQPPAITPDKLETAEETQVELKYRFSRCCLGMFFQGTANDVQGASVNELTPALMLQHAV